MIKTRRVSLPRCAGERLIHIAQRYGETLQQAPNILQVTPFENTNRHLRHISDYATYKKLHSTLPAAVLSALKSRVKAGEPKAIRELWEKKDKTFLAIDLEWSERNEKSCLEFGYAAVRCGHLDALGHWPPSPENYRKGHFIIAEYVDKVVNKHCPTHPWHYAFGDSQIAPKAKLSDIIQAVISLASPDSETTANTLVLVAHGISGDLARLEEMRIKLPHNMLVINTATYERVLHSTGLRGIMLDPRTNSTRTPSSTLSLENMLRSFTTHPISPPPASVSPVPLVLPNVKMHNAGNDAFLCLFALQFLLDPANTPVFSLKKGLIGRPGFGGPRPHSLVLLPNLMLGPMPSSSPSTFNLAAEFGQMNTRERSPGPNGSLQPPNGSSSRRVPGRSSGRR
ncbi:hypothetical protein DXG03_001507 [Asterophora parasitica]|uniref:Gfd2/YDR514C-like C-terminal domain-containing protein n=1 Tax=Asterophora parasitica TaxID=117018 RepID=A0A9P7G5G0_9AGAR|nr:hypothetical protein DXG03_001507 [Asterophora parasitica]